MHTHVSAVTGAQVLLMVLIGATLWRLGWATVAVTPDGSPRAGIVGDVARAALTQL